MRIALLLRGITYNDHYKHWSGGIMKIDYKHNILNVIEQIIKPLKAEHDVDLYISTYKSAKENDIIKDFDPFASIFIDSCENQITCILKGLELIQQSALQYDFVIVSRFDLLLLPNILEIPYDINKFNFIWKENPEEDPNCVGDCMHFFAFKFLDSFIATLKQYTYTLNLHKIRDYLLTYISPTDIHYIYDPVFNSNSDKCKNPLYVIQRGQLLIQNARYSKYFGKKSFGLIKM